MRNWTSQGIIREDWQLFNITPSYSPSYYWQLVFVRFLWFRKIPEHQNLGLFPQRPRGKKKSPVLIGFQWIWIYTSSVQTKDVGMCMHKDRVCSNLLLFIFGCNRKSGFICDFISSKPASSSLTDSYKWVLCTCRRLWSLADATRESVKMYCGNSSNKPSGNFTLFMKVEFEPVIQIRTRTVQKWPGTV